MPALFLFLTFVSFLEAKINVFAHYFGQPEFIHYQYQFFKQNLLDEYEFVVFEDSRDPDLSEQIQQECQKHGIKCIRIPDSEFETPKLPITDSYIELISPSFQCAVATQYIYDHYIVNSEEICLILDNDIFLLSPFSIEKYLGDYAFSYVREEREGPDHLIYYALPNFILFNPRLMPQKGQLNFNLGTIFGARTDSGGHTYFYLRDYAHLGKQMARYYLNDTGSPLKDRFGNQYPLAFHSKEWSVHCFLEKDTFLHMRMGSNWSRHPNYSKMKQELTSLFDQLLN